MNLFKDSPYFIAEIGVNHEGDIELAKEMIRQVAEAGGNAAKFQTYKADLIAAKNSPAYWDKSLEPTETQHKLFKKYDTFNRHDYELLAEECYKNGIDFLSTPFDTDCLDWLIPLQNAIKIASADLTNDILLEAVAKFKKPIILSVGASSDLEIAHALDILFDANVPRVVLLHCILIYPTPVSKAYLARIQSLKVKFANDKVSIGYSDHIPADTAQNDQILIAYSMGCDVIEKHFTYNKLLKGNDHYHALDKNDLIKISQRLKIAKEMISSNDAFDSNGLQDQKSAIQNARRGLYFRRSLKKGEIIRIEDIIPKRPSTKISPSQYKDVLGQTVLRDVYEGDPIDQEKITNNK